MSILKLGISYLKSRYLFSIIGLYFLIAIILKELTFIDITIPCLIKYIFHFECLGCGMTRAITYLMKGKFHEAYTYNKGVFIVLPLFIYFFYNDYIRFLKQNNK